MKFQEKTKEETGQFTIDPKLNSTAKKRKPSPKLEEANAMLSRLKKNKKHAGFFL